MSLLQYNPEQDASVFLNTQVVIHGLQYEISAGTTAGRSEPDSPQKPNEDAFRACIYPRTEYLAEATGIAVGVFDGASSQQQIPELKGVSGARFASHALGDIFIDEPITGDVRSTVSGLNQALGERFRGFASVKWDDLNTLPTSTATVGQIDTTEHVLSVGHVGDSFGAALMQDGSTRLLTNNLHRQYDEKVLQLILDIANEEDITPREARKDPRIRQAIMAMFQGTRNRPDGTGEGMVNGDPHMDQYIHTESLPLRGVRAVLFGSDGLVPPSMDERKPGDREALFAITEDVGVQGLIRYTREVEREDPDRWHIRYKHSDDATGLLVTISDAS